MSNESDEPVILVTVIQGKVGDPVRGIRHDTRQEIQYVCPDCETPLIFDKNMDKKCPNCGYLHITRRVFGGWSKDQRP